MGLVITVVLAGVIILGKVVGRIVPLVFSHWLRLWLYWK